MDLMLWLVIVSWKNKPTEYYALVCKHNIKMIKNIFLSNSYFLYYCEQSKLEPSLIFRHIVIGYLGKIWGPYTDYFICKFPSFSLTICMILLVYTLKNFFFDSLHLDLLRLLLSGFLSQTDETYYLCLST